MKNYIIILVLLLIVIFFEFPNSPLGSYIQRCTDTDGKDYYTYGYAYKYNSIILTDKCFGNRLREAYCHKGMVAYELTDCRFGCYEDACLIEPQSCIDTDQGKNYYVAGIVSKAADSFQDSCAMDVLLKEYYCEGNKVKKVLYMCPNGCENKACL